MGGGAWVGGREEMHGQRSSHGKYYTCVVMVLDIEDGTI